MTMTYLTTIEAKEEFSELINRVTHNKERIVLTRRGKEIAAIISFEDFQDLQQTQNKNDLDQAVEALQEARSKGSVTLEDFKAELG
jgi:prevent-host-death family protein